MTKHLSLTGYLHMPLVIRYDTDATHGYARVLDVTHANATPERMTTLDPVLNAIVRAWALPHPTPHLRDALWSPEGIGMARDAETHLLRLCGALPPGGADLLPPQPPPPGGAFYPPSSASARAIYANWRRTWTRLGIEPPRTAHDRPPNHRHVSALPPREHGERAPARPRPKPRKRRPAPRPLVEARADVAGWALAYLTPDPTAWAPRADLRAHVVSHVQPSPTPQALYTMLRELGFVEARRAHGWGFRCTLKKNAPRT